MKISKKLKSLIKNSIPIKILIFFRIVLTGIKSKRRLKLRKNLNFEIHLADHCNLNCKGCDHFSPIAPENFLDLQIFERDCMRLAELTDNRIEEIRLLGGEPLLHPKIIEILFIARHYFHSGKVTVFTNGILLPKQPDTFWQACKDNAIGIVITNYPIKIDHDAIKNKANAYIINLEYFGNNADLQYKLSLDIEGRQNIKYNKKYCFKLNECAFLRNGKIYPCPTIPCIDFFNTYYNKSLQVTDHDCIDIYKVNSIEEIFNFMCKPVSFCKYCNFKGIKYGVGWGISRKDISEWT